jgi:exodeoxyribonuclease VII large subunit
MNSRPTLSVDELSELVRFAITSSPGLRNLAVRGELQNFKRHSSGHAYFTMIGRESRISCVLFRSHAGVVIDWPEDGDEVLVTGSVDVYPKGGAYQLYAARIIPIGLGARSRAKEELRAMLEREGLFDIRHKRPLPKYPSKVVVVTSPTGAAVQDILKVSANRAPFVDIVIAPAVVQGADAPIQIVKALALCGRLKGAECVILARGGGAKDDLSPFDDERVVRAVRSCPLPVVTGVGHQTDSSLADLAADAALPTPSAAAERVFPDSREIVRTLFHVRDALASGVLRVRSNFQNLLEKRGERLARLTESHISDCRKLLDGTSREITTRILAAIERKEAELSSAASSLDALSPLAVLGRGFSICRDSNGALVKSAGALTPGDAVNIRFLDGDVEADVRSARVREAIIYTNLKSGA